MTPDEPRVRPVPGSLVLNEDPETVAVAFCFAVQAVPWPSWIVKSGPPESWIVAPRLNCWADENTSLVEPLTVSTVPLPATRSRRVLAAIGASYQGRSAPKGRVVVKSVCYDRRSYAGSPLSRNCCSVQAVVEVTP